MRIGAAAAAGVAAVPQAFAAPSAAIRVRVTAGAKRLAEAPPLAWRAPGASSAEAIVLDPSRAYQDILGFGGAFTDAACANFHRLEPGARDTLTNRRTLASIWLSCLEKLQRDFRPVICAV